MPFTETDDGVLLYFEHFGHGPCVLITPHPVQSGQIYRQLLPLSESFRLVFHETRNTGRSSALTPSPVSVDRLADDIEFVRMKLACEGIILIAHSAGGFAAIRYAVRYAKYVIGIVLLSSGNSAEGIQQLSQAMIEKNNNDPHFQKLITYQIACSKDESAAKAIKEFIIRFGSSENALKAIKNISIGQLGKFSEYNAAALAESEINNYSPSFCLAGTPVALILGEMEARGIPKKNIASLLSLPKKTRVQTVENAGHFTWLENQTTIEKIKSEINLMMKN